MHTYMSHVHMRTCADQSRDTGTLHTLCHTICMYSFHIRKSRTSTAPDGCARLSTSIPACREAARVCGCPEPHAVGSRMAELRRSAGTEELLIKSSSLLSFWSGRRICSCVGRAAPVGTVCVDGEDDAALECGSASLRELCCTLLEADVIILESLLTRIVAG